MMEPVPATIVRKTRAEMLQALKEAVAAVPAMEEKIRALNAYRNQEISRIDARHRIGQGSYIGDFTEEFSDLAEAVVATAYDLARTQALKSSPAPMAREGEPSRCAVLGLGKFGGRELGFASALEMMLVYTDDPDTHSERSRHNSKFYNEVVKQLRNIIRPQREGVFEIDWRLRPYGEDGPLAASLAAFRAYYGQGGKAWNFERQMLISLRPVAGDPDFGREIQVIRDNLVYADQPFDFKEALRWRVRQQEKRAQPGMLNAKYGTGGLLDIESLVRILQIVYGRQLAGETRHPNTFKAIRALWQAGVLTEHEFQELRSGYLFLRHLINALRIARGHAKDLTLPHEDSAEYISVGRSLGFYGDDKKIKAQFHLTSWHFMQKISELYESWMQKLAETDWALLTAGMAARPVLPRISLDDWLRGDLAAQDRRILAAIGFTDVDASTQHLQRLAGQIPSFEHFAKVMDQVWGVWPQVADPDLAMQHLDRYLEHAADKDVFWKMLQEAPEGISILLRVFGSGRYLSQRIVQDPEHFAWIRSAENLTLDLTRETLQEMQSGELTLEGLRALRHRETLRIALAETIGQAPLETVHQVYSDLADFILGHGLNISGLAEELSVIGLGQLGGRELPYGLNLDLLFLSAGAKSAADLTAGVEKFLKILQEGALENFLYRVDRRLCPHGENGRLVMTVEDATHYYQKQAQPRERQALIRARAVAGERQAAGKFLAQMAALVWQPVWTAEDFEKLREMKKRAEKQTAAEGETSSNIRMGCGGLGDVEFTVQMLQLRHAHDPALRQGNTFRALETLHERKLLKEEEYRSLHEAYHFLRRVENRLQLYENRPVLNVPQERPAKRRLARDMGFADSGGKTAEEAFEAQLGKTMQASREVFERLDYADAVKA